MPINNDLTWLDDNQKVRSTGTMLWKGHATMLPFFSTSEESRG